MLTSLVIFAAFLDLCFMNTLDKKHETLPDNILIIKNPLTSEKPLQEDTSETDETKRNEPSVTDQS